MFKRMLFSITLAATLGCHDATAPLLIPAFEPGQITISTERSAYRPIDIVVVTTTNSSGVTVYDDHCGGEVEGYELLKRWNASYGSGRACWDSTDANWRAHSVAMLPGAVHVDTMFVNSQAYTGTWRVMLFLRVASGAPLLETQRVSNTFHVDGTWAP